MLSCSLVFMHQNGSLLPHRYFNRLTTFTPSSIPIAPFTRITCSRNLNIFLCFKISSIKLLFSRCFLATSHQRNLSHAHFQFPAQLRRCFPCVTTSTNLSSFVPLVLRPVFSKLLYNISIAYPFTHSYIHINTHIHTHIYIVGRGILGSNVVGLSPALELIVIYVNLSGMRPRSRLSSQPWTIPAPWVLLRVIWSILMVPWLHPGRLPSVSLRGIGRLS